MESPLIKGPCTDSPNLKTNAKAPLLQNELKSQLGCMHFNATGCGWWNTIFRKNNLGGFLGGPVAKALSCQCRRPGFSLWSQNQIHMPQLRVCMPQLKILLTETKTWCSQIKKKKYIYIYICISVFCQCNVKGLIPLYTYILNLFVIYIVCRYKIILWKKL